MTKHRIAGSRPSIEQASPNRCIVTPAKIDAEMRMFRRKFPNSELIYIESLMDVARATLMADWSREMPCPGCGKPCKMCNAEHAAYSPDCVLLEIIIGDFLCMDCPAVWAVMETLAQYKDRVTRAAMKKLGPDGNGKHKGTK